jgi:RND family efflux transporter MFP subunit
MRKRWIVIVLLLLVVLAGGGAYSYYRFVLTPAQAQEQPTVLTTQVTQGDVTISADGTGNLLPSAEVSVGFQTSGLLKTLEVKVGDHVTAGQTLGTLDTRDLELELEKARLQLDQAQTSLDALATGPSDTSVTVARNSLSQARDNLAQQQVSLSAATERARLSWVESANNLRDAQASYSEIYWSNLNLQKRLAERGQTLPQADIDAEAAAWHAVENAESAMEQARLSYETAKNQEETSLKTAQSQVSTAQANLNELFVGASATDLASAQASVDQARISYEQAQVNLDKTVLKAPIAGTVMTVSAHVGEQVGTSTIITLADMDAPLLEFWVEEADMAAAQVGNPVNVVFEALPDLTFTGTVVQVDPALVTVSNTPAVQAWARLNLSAHSERLLSGMTAQVEAIQAEARNVLMVPLEALRDLGNGQYAVFVVGANGELELRPVEVGLQDLVNAEIRSGLQAGEVVSLGEQTSTGQQSTTTGTNPGGMMPAFGPIFEGR